MRAMTDTLPAAPLAGIGDTAVVDVRQHSSATLHLKGGAVAATDTAATVAGIVVNATRH